MGLILSNDREWHEHLDYIKTNPYKIFLESSQKWYQSKKGSKDQKSIQPSTTPDPGYHMGKRQNTIKHRKQEPRGQSYIGIRDLGYVIMIKE